MNFYRIWAVFIRHLYLIIKNPSGIFHIIYWPMLNVIIWGTTSSWIQRQSIGQNMIIIILSGYILWQIVFRVNIEISKSLLDEITTNNLINLYSTPLKFSEWVIGILLVSVIQMMLVLISSSIPAYFLYSVNIFSLGYKLIPIIILLLMSGWFIGLFLCGLLMSIGKKAQDFIYSIGWVFAPFSAIYYPVDSLPFWMQKISYFIPMSYIFEGVRELIASNTISSNFLFYSFILNCFYLILSILFFISMFNKSKQAGLIKVD